MRYFATASGPRVREAMCDPRNRDILGQIIQPAAGNKHLASVMGIADNGIFSDSYTTNTEYLRWLSKQGANVEWAVAPDVVADHSATLERSWPMLRPIRETVGRVALCAQNGAHPDDMPWDYIDTVFLAGIPECTRCAWVPPVVDAWRLEWCLRCMGPLAEWKEGPAAVAITAEAVRRGKWVHMGRVNSYRRLHLAHTMGCLSGDGTTVAKAPKNIDEVLRWLRRIARQDGLFEVAVPA